MKFKTTKTAIMNGYSKIIKVGYCDLQTLLQCVDPIAYTACAEGRAADIYDIDGVAIVTGYAPFGKISVDHNITAQYEALARAIANTAEHWDDKKAKCRDLLSQFVKEVTENV